MLRPIGFLTSALLLAPLLLNGAGSGLAREVMVKPGDTLSEIAEHYGVSILLLMQANGLEDPGHIEVGQSLRLSGAAAGKRDESSLLHTVKPGETLSEIAEQYDVSTAQLAALNQLDDNDYVQAGDRLRLSKSGRAPTRPLNVEPDASKHVVAAGQALSQIAEAYDLPTSRLMALNGINDADRVLVGQRLTLRGGPKPESVPEAKREAPSASESQTATTAKPEAAAAPTSGASVTTTTTAATSPSPAPAPGLANDPDWRSYGPLRVDWSNWLLMEGSHVAPTLNTDDQPLYLAVNCSARKLNATGASGAWKTWDPPRSDFERRILEDLCREKGA